MNDYDVDDRGEFGDYVEADDLTTPETDAPAAPEQPPASSNPEPGQDKEPSPIATWAGDTAKAIGGWAADHPLIVAGLGYLVVGYFMSPRWLPWRLFKD